jgi:hypothetical protein
LEARLQTGNLKVLLGNRLFQKGCLNYQCKSAIEPCNAIALEPAGNEAITPTPFNADKDTLLEKVAALSNSDVKSWDNLTQAFFEVSVASQAAGINDVVRLFSKMVTTEQVATTINGVENYCDKEHWDHQNNRENPQWQMDPCCNWALRETMCCAPKSVPGKMLTKISGVDMGVVKTFCNNPEKVKVMLNDLQTQLTKATEASAELGEKTGKKALDNLWKFKDICMKEVGMNQHDREELECTADSDCKCTYQKCVQGKCNVPYSNLGECFAQCFRKQVDKQVLEHLKKEFEVSPTDGDDKFEAAFITHMTEETCIGDRQWEEGIGENREEWRCDTLCTKQNLCHSHDVIHAYQDQCYQNLHHSLHRDTCDVWSSKTACALASNYAPGYTTTAEDRPANEDGSSNGFECKVTKTDDTAPTLPCDCDHCYKPCNSKPHCEAAGGEYFYHETDEAGKPVHDHGQCCPAGAFVHSNKENSPGQSEAVIRSDCKPYAPGTPPRWTMQNEMCCVNSGGSWKTGGNKYDSCCFGEWEEKVKADGSIEFRCDEWVDTHKPCDECRQKNCPYSECSACEKARENCCGPTLLYANKTACLLHESCNDGSVEHQIRMYNNNEGNELERDRGIATCGNYKAPAGKEDSVTYLYDDQPMCAECWGPHCDRRTEVARCILEEITDPSGLDLFGAKIRIDEDICENKLGRTWISHGWGNHGNCMDRDATDEADCYRRNIQANKETFTFTSTGTYTMAIGKTVTQNGNVVGVLGVALGGTAAEDIIVVAQAGAALTTTDALTLDAAGTNVAVQASDLTAVNSVLGETVSAAAATLACNDRTMLTDWQKQQIEDATGLARSHADFPTPTVIRTEGRCEIQCSVEPDGGTTGTTCNDHANFHYQAGDRKMCALNWG